MGLAGLAVGLSLQPPRPRLVWNTTASAPLGAYRLDPRAAPQVGDWVAVRPPPTQAAWLAARGYLPAGALLIKRVAARSPSQVCRRGDHLWRDGRPVAQLAAADHLGRPLPVWSGCRALRPDELLLLNSAPGSLDSRYLGPARARDLVGRATPWRGPAEAAHAR